MKLSQRHLETFHATAYRASIVDLATTDASALQKKEVSKVRQIHRLASKIGLSTPSAIATGAFAVLTSGTGGKQLRVACDKLEIIRNVMTKYGILLHRCDERTEVTSIILALASVGIGGALSRSAGNILAAAVDSTQGYHGTNFVNTSQSSIGLETPLQVDSPEDGDSAYGDSGLVTCADMDFYVDSTATMNEQIDAGRRGQDACIQHARLALKQFEILPSLVGERNVSLKHLLEFSSRESTEALEASFAASKALRHARQQAAECTSLTNVQRWKDALDAFRDAIDHLDSVLARWANQLDRARSETLWSTAVLLRPVQEEKVLRLYRATENAAITHYRGLRDDYDADDVALTMSELCDAVTNFADRVRLVELHKAMVDAIDGTYTRRGTCARLAHDKLIETRQQWEKAMFPSTKNKRFMMWHQSLGTSIRANLEFEIAGKAFSDHMYSVMEATKALEEMVEKSEREDKDEAEDCSEECWEECSESLRDSGYGSSGSRTEHRLSEESFTEADFF